MDAARAAAGYRNALARHGIGITLKRRNAVGTPNPTMTSAPAKARVRDYEPRELVGDVQQGDLMAIVLVEDLVAASWPVPPKKGDVVEIGAKTFNVEAVDDRTRMVGATLIAYVIRLRG